MNKYRRRMTAYKKKAVTKQTMNNMRTRRYRPKRTYRRKYTKKCGEGSMLCGTSYGQAFKLNQTFQAIDPAGENDIFWDKDGLIVTSPAEISTTALRASPDEIIGLRERKKFYKHWKITGVKYHFYKDAMAANNGAVGYANYVDKYDGLQSKVVYNPLDEDVPMPIDSTAFSQQYADWIVQQKGQLLPTLNGKKKNVYTKAYMNKLVTFTNGQNENEEKQLVPFPWLNSELNATLLSSDLYSTGLCNTYIPRVQISPLLNNPTFTLLRAQTLPGQNARARLSQRFQWYCRIQLFWRLKGKYYDKDLVPSPSNAPVPAPEDVVEFPLAPSQEMINAVCEDLKMSDDDN